MVWWKYDISQVVYTEKQKTFHSNVSFSLYLPFIVFGLDMRSDRMGLNFGLYPGSSIFIPFTAFIPFSTSSLQHLYSHKLFFYVGLQV